jgi:hypothetical protein
VYSLSFPGLAVTSEAVPGHERKLKPLVDFCLDKDRGAFIAFVCVLVVDCCMMLLGIIATLLNDGYQLAELW